MQYYWANIKCVLTTCYGFNTKRLKNFKDINNKSVNEATLRTAENKFKKLEIALVKVDDEGFGICDRCNQPIPEGRLMIMPESNLCVNCAQR